MTEADANPMTLATATFIGRADACTELSQLLDEARLVTLVGAPGCGKTRLAAELAQQRAENYEAGVIVVELASVRDGDLVVLAIAAALALEERADRDVLDSIVETLATQTRLLVLDNCEHVVDTVASIAARLLQNCRPLRILTTSRTAVGLRGEHVWQVPPLAKTAAIQLFRARAVAPWPDGADGSNDQLIERICERLDGLPLALELAASWSHVLSPAEILERLEQTIVDPGSGSTTIGSRVVRTMRTAVDKSYQLLDRDARGLFSRLSVFAGGFDLDAAQAMLPSGEVLEPLGTLVRHSLVLAEPSPSGSMRYRLLEPVRQRAHELLPARLDSKRTVETHVNNIKSKLGFARRTRIVAWVLDQSRPERFR